MLRTASIAFIAVMFAAASASAQQPPPSGYGYQQQPPQQGSYQGQPQQPPPQGSYQGQPQQPPPQQQPPQSNWGQQPAPQQQPAQQTATQNSDGSIRVVEQGSPEAQAVTAKQGRGLELGGHVVVPIFATVPNLLPGIGIQGRFGWEFPHGLTAELNLGVQGNRYQHYSDSLIAYWVGAGLRYSFLNPSAIVPFMGLNLQANFWKVCYSTGSGSCTGTTTDAGLGLVPLVGIAWELNPTLALEGGVQVTLTIFNAHNKIGMNTAEVYVSPFLGGTVYF